MKPIVLAAALLLFGASPFVSAQPAPSLQAQTLEGKPFRLASLKGKVVLLVFWSTSCAVCRDKMPELRQGLEGWRNKPFELVLVNTDRRIEDLVEYDRILAAVVPPRQRLIQVWAGAPGYASSFGAPAQLPTSYVIDKDGKVAKQYVGRMPTDAWNDIADLVY